MGCKQSKDIPVHQRDQGLKTNLTSPMSSNSFGNVSIPREVNRISDPGQRLMKLLQISKTDELVWARIIKICEKAPKAVSYQDPESLDTPLHLACRLISTTPPGGDSLDSTPLDAVRVMIRCSADASLMNKNGHIALHDAIRPIVCKNDPLASIHNQCQVAGFLIAADYDSSVEYLCRTDITFDSDDDACTPLYHVISNLPDDFSNSPGPTTTLASTLHFPVPFIATTKNDSNYDKPLALLYRRFSRQFDLSEKFFPGDNSRREVVEHRQKYKVAAMNTWKIILSLLDPILDKKKSVSDFFMVHAAVKSECPPDLLRYIIETRPEEVRQVNDLGRLPLHVAAKASPDAAESCYHYKFVIDELLYSYPDGAASKDAHGKLPLQLAIESGKNWVGGGVKSLHDVYPDAISKVKMDDYPSIKRALSFSTNFEEKNDTATDESITNENGGVVVREEHYDAIMLVQKTDADLGDIVSAMWANEEDGGVQMLGCMAITTLAIANLNNQKKIRSIAMSAVNTIVNAMKNHPNEPAVQEKGCSALNILASADNYHEVSFAASGAISCVVSAMQAHVSDEIVQKEGSATLRNIMKYGGSDRATVIASVSGFTALQNAIGAHPNVESVQREASAALEVLSSFPDANLPDFNNL